MRKLIYNYAVRLPSKLISGVATILGIVSIFQADWARNTFLPFVAENTIQITGGVLLALSYAYVILLWQLKPSASPTENPGGFVIGGNATLNFNNFQQMPEKIKIEEVVATTSSDETVATDIGHLSAHVDNSSTLHGIYVGNIVAAAGALKKEHRLELAIIGYNGSGEALQIGEISGHIRAGNGNFRDMDTLPIPAVKNAMKVEHGTEFRLILNQHLPPKLARIFLLALNDGHLQLDLDGLKIKAVATSNSGRMAYLPLWDAVLLRRRDDIVSNRVHVLRAVGIVAGTPVLGSPTLQVSKAS